MQKTMLAMLCVLSMSAATAHAEHKLFVTDILADRQVEVEADFDYGHNSAGYTMSRIMVPLTGALTSAPGNQTRNTVSSTYSLGIGIGHGLQLNAAIPYVFSDNITQHDNYHFYYPSLRPAYFNKQDGLGDIALGVKYSLYENRERALSVVTGLDLRLFAADNNKAGIRTNEIAPFIAASTVINKDMKPYAAYQVILRNHGEASQTISTGLDYEINKTITLSPKFSAIFRTDSNWTTAYNSYAFGLSSYVNIYPNLYLTPNFSTGINTATYFKNYYTGYDTLKFVTAGLGLYYLFN